MAVEARILAKEPIRAGEWIPLPQGGLIFLSGMGADRARLAARTLLENGATALVSWGFAGGLDPNLSPGSLILPAAILAMDQSIHRVDPAWHEALGSRLKPHLGFGSGLLAESPGILASREERAALFHRTGATAVDMESASVALVAEESGVPLLVIRAITDTTQRGIPRALLNSIDEFGRLRLSRFLPGLTRHPAELLALFPLGRNYRVARATLAKVALRAASNLFCPSEPATMTASGKGNLILPAAEKGEKS
jgi:adenosylhomocysteine nucleosidase